MTEVHGFMCGPKIYEFSGWTFEYDMTGAWPLRKDGEPRARAGRKFYKMLDKFCAMSDEQQKTYRIGGGCRSF